MLQKNTLAVVLNGSSTEGINTAKDLIHQYNKVLLVGQDRKELKSAMLEITAQCPAEKVMYIEADLTSKAELAKFICLVKDKFGGADIVINCMEIHDEHERGLFESALREFEDAAVNQFIAV